jgi:CHASE2 domain-containing sensor protein
VSQRADIEDEGDLRVGARPVPPDDEGPLRINSVGPPGSFRVIEFRRVLEAARGPAGRSRESPFPGAIALIGMTAASQQDRHATPFANNAFRYLVGTESDLMGGPEIHANIVATLADRAFTAEPRWPTSPPAMVAAGAALGLIFERLNLTWGTPCVYVGSCVWPGSARPAKWS